MPRARHIYTDDELREGQNRCFGPPNFGPSWFCGNSGYLIPWLRSHPGRRPQERLGLHTTPAAATVHGAAALAGATEVIVPGVGAIPDSTELVRTPTTMPSFTDTIESVAGGAARGALNAALNGTNILAGAVTAATETEPPPIGDDTGTSTATGPDAGRATSVTRTTGGGGAVGRALNTAADYMAPGIIRAGRLAGRLVRLVGLDAAAAALGWTVQRTALAAVRPRRRRGISARDIRTTRRTLNTVVRIYHSLPHRGITRHRRT